MIDLVQPFLIPIHLAATWVMVGVIWIVQLVHYPLFSYVERERFVEFERKHCFRIGWVVMPTMLLEAGTAAFLLQIIQDELFIYSLGLLFVCWVSTATLHGPYHNKLANGFDEKIHQKLVRTNWIRTIAWSGRGVLVALSL